jgi:phosphoglycerate dehydrogenase-like enzyme
MDAERRILVTVLPLNDEHLEYLKKQTDGFPCRLVYKRSGLSADDLADVDAVIGNVPAALLPAAKKLKWLQLNSAGADPYARSGVLPEGCRLTTASGAYGLTVSEHMLALTFALVRRLNQYIGAQREGQWKSCGHIISVENSTVLVLGLGDIGGSYARKMNALGAHVIGVRRHTGEKPGYLDEIHTIDELDSLLPCADIVAMVLPGTPETAHLMDERRLRLMKKGAYLINVGRGSAVDPAGLKKVILDGWLGGAALDVTEPEPLPPEDPLWRMDKVIITPHVAGHFFLAETVNRIVRIAGENLRAWLQGTPLQKEVRL